MNKLPKKLKDAFELIRNGKVKAGIQMFNLIEGFDPQKNMALAEVAYFQHDWEKGLELSFSYLRLPGETYYSNIYDEHFDLVLLAAYKTNTWEKALKFFKDILKIYTKVGNKQKIFLIKKKISELKNKEKFINEFENAKPKKRTAGKSLEEITKQQEEYKPKFSAKGKEVDKADYILYFLHREGKTADFIKIYSQFGQELFYENHKRAAHEYLAMNDIKNAQKSLMKYVHTWYPVEHMQVEPVILMTEKELLPALDKKFCEKVLKTAKALRN